MENKIFIAQAKIVKALAHPVRLSIIHLTRHHVLTVGQIVTMLGESQSIVSQHLSSLKKVGILTSSREGKEIYYTVADAQILKACDAIHSLVAKISLPISPEPDVVDLVCGMTLTPSTASFYTTYNGVRHYFCGKGCQKFFDLDPNRYYK